MTRVTITITEVTRQQSLGADQEAAALPALTLGLQSPDGAGHGGAGGGPQGGGGGGPGGGERGARAVGLTVLNMLYRDLKWRID